MPTNETDIEKSSGSGVEWVDETAAFDFSPETTTNRFGLSVSQVRKISRQLDRLLTVPNPPHPDTCETYSTVRKADIETAKLLVWWQFEPETTIEILRYYRNHDDLTPESAVRTATAAVSTTVTASYARALLMSVNGRRPAASHDTIRLVAGSHVDRLADNGGQPVTTAEIADSMQLKQVWSDIKRESRQRKTRRSLHILADAGCVIRRESVNGYLWDISDDSELIPIPPY